MDAWSREDAEGLPKGIHGVILLCASTCALLLVQPHAYCGADDDLDKFATSRTSCGGTQATPTRHLHAAGAIIYAVLVRLSISTHAG